MRNSSSTWVKLCNGQWVWQVRAGWRGLIEGSDHPDWLDLARDSRARLVKENDGRQVWRVEVDSRVAYAKVCLGSGRWARYRRLLLGSAAQRECRVAEYADSHGIRAVLPVALAEAKSVQRDSRCVLITAGLPNALPLDRFWFGLDGGQPSTRQVKNQVIDAVARLVAHAHQNGFRHRDLHAGNVLVEPCRGVGYEALFVDLHNVRVGRRVNTRGVIRNLAQFNQWFAIRGSLTDRIRFLGRYLHWREVEHAGGSHSCRLDCGKRELVRRLERAAFTHARALYVQRDRRAMRSGRYFARLTLDKGWRARVFLQAKHAMPGSRASETVFTTTQWKRWLQQPLRLVKPADRRLIIKDSRTATVCRGEVPVDGGPRLAVICKRARARSIVKRIMNTFRRSRAMRTWQRANALLNRQIPTARPLAVLEQRRFGLLRDSIVVTEAVEDAHDLDTVLTMHLRQLGEVQQRRLKAEITEALVAVIHRMHDRGIVHCDFKPPNVLVRWDPELAAKPSVMIVDLDGVRRARNGRHRAGVRMLMRLNVGLDHCRRVTCADRLRFLKAYLDHPYRRPASWKPIWREIMSECERKRRMRDRHQAWKLAKYGRI